MPTRSRTLDQLRSANDPSPRNLPRRNRPPSVGRQWKFRRNLVILIASRAGVSQRMLADVFDLPHSRIAAILKEMRAAYGPAHPDR